MSRINHMVKATTLSNGAEVWEAEEEYGTVGGKTRKLRGVLIRVKKGSKPAVWYSLDVFYASIRKVSDQKKWEAERTKLGGV